MAKEFINPLDSTTTFNLLPREAQTLFTMFVFASLAAVGHTDIPTGQDLQSLASQAYDDLHITSGALSEPEKLDTMLDAYFGKNRLVN